MGQFGVYARNDECRSIGRAQSPRWCMGLYQLAFSTKRLYRALQKLKFVKNTREKLGTHLTRTEIWRTQDKNAHFLYTRSILDLMRSLVNHWSPLTHTSHCMSTSRPAAATQMRKRLSPAMQPKIFLRQIPSRCNPLCFRARGPAQNIMACVC